VASGTKSHAGDALVIAEYLRLRQHRLRVAAPYSGQARALRIVVRARSDLVEMRVAATNQLTALLDAHWPGTKAVFADVESPIALDFLARYPTGGLRGAARRKADGRVLRQACLLRPSSRRRARGTVARRPGWHPDQAVTQAVGDAVLAMVAVLRAVASSPQRPYPVSHHPPWGTPGREDLHVAATVGPGQRCPDAGRVGRLPRSLRLC
jgi:hypothetical protein